MSPEVPRHQKDSSVCVPGQIGDSARALQMETPTPSPRVGKAPAQGSACSAQAPRISAQALGPPGLREGHTCTHLSAAIEAELPS